MDLENCDELLAGEAAAGNCGGWKTCTTSCRGVDVDLQDVQQCIGVGQLVLRWIVHPVTPTDP